MKVAIWGAGKFGQYIKEQLNKREDITLVGFIDSNLGGQYIGNLKVMSLSQIKEYQIDLILIAIMDYTSVFSQLENEDISRIGVIKGNVYRLKKMLSKNILEDENIVWLNTMEMHKPILKHLQTNIMDGCNLNCKGCSHFANLFAKDVHIPFESICKDLQQIAAHTFILQLYFLGGEPLLNERCIDYIDFARKILPWTEIGIFTNGLLIPKQSEDFFICCRKNDVVIHITGYKPTLLIKEKIENILKDERIAYKFEPEVLSFGKNIDLQGRANPDEAFKSCRESTCHFFRNGKIYKCPFEVLGNSLFDYYDLDIHLDGGVDIYAPNLNWDELIAKLDEEPVDACCYCGKEESIPWKVENHPKLDDWIIRMDK